MTAVFGVDCNGGRDYSHQEKGGDNWGEIAVEIMRNVQIQDIFLKVEPIVFPDRLDKARERKKRSQGCLQSFGPG